MTTPKEALERIRDHSVGTTADGPCIECEHMIEEAKATIPVAELHEQAVELLKDAHRGLSFEWWQRMDALLAQRKALK